MTFRKISSFVILFFCEDKPLAERGHFVGIYCPLITDWIESTQAQILFTHQMQNWDTEPNSKYCLKEYFSIE